MGSEAQRVMLTTYFASPRDEIYYIDPCPSSDLSASPDAKRKLIAD
jgi:hypothetical protein